MAVLLLADVVGGQLAPGDGRVEQLDLQVDADFAQETAALSRAQILQQAGTAMLAQANSSKQGVLALLQG